MSQAFRQKGPEVQALWSKKNMTPTKENKGKSNEKRPEDMCPKCKSRSLTIHGNNTGYTVTDIHSEYFEIFKCNACGFEFSMDYNKRI